MINFTRSFTLVEITITIGIIMLIMGASVFPAMTQLQRSRDAKRKADLTTLRNALEQYYDNINAYPDSLPACNTPLNANGVNVLKSIPCDPKTKQSYVYIADSSPSQTFKLYTKLETTSDPIIKTIGCVSGCGPSCSYNYGVASSNTSINSCTVALSPTPVPTLPPIPPTSTPTTAPTTTPRPTSTPTPTPTFVPTATPTVTPRPTSTPLPTPTMTPIPTATNTPIPTPTATPRPTSTPTPTPTTTPKPTATPTPTITPTPANILATLNPTDDTYADDNCPNCTAGSETILYVDLDDPLPMIGYMKFNTSALVGKTIVSAYLRITLNSDDTAGSVGTHYIRVVPSSAWSEATLTYNNRPSVSSTTLGSLTNSTYNTTYNIALNASLLQSNMTSAFSLAIDPGSTDGIHVLSKETSSKPALVVTYH